MFQRILIPLDGSKVGEAALPYVEDLISKLSPEVKVEVILIQVLSSVSTPVMGGEAGIAVDYTEQQMKQSKDRAMDYLNKFGEAIRGKGITITAKVAVGHAAEEDDPRAAQAGLAGHRVEQVERPRVEARPVAVAGDAQPPIVPPPAQASHVVLGELLIERQVEAVGRGHRPPRAERSVEFERLHVELVAPWNPDRLRQVPVWRRTPDPGSGNRQDHRSGRPR